MTGVVERMGHHPRNHSTGETEKRRPEKITRITNLEDDMNDSQRRTFLTLMQRALKLSQGKAGSLVAGAARLLGKRPTSLLNEINPNGIPNGRGWAKLGAVDMMRLIAYTRDTRPLRFLARVAGLVAHPLRLTRSRREVAA
ncbi:MAG: hypothetical protein OEV94_11950 [Deltaproteobacteria bacterium]|nr:hypothetical protein [Deltaproteobacteria bacterium]